MSSPADTRKATARAAASSGAASGSSMAAEDALTDEGEEDPMQAAPMQAQVSCNSVCQGPFVPFPTSQYVWQCTVSLFQQSVIM